MDAALLEQAAGTVVVTALAAAPGHDYRAATDHGVRHFAELADASGVDVEVVAAPDARFEAAQAALRRARLLVLPGGSPARLLEALTSTGADAVVSEVLDGGGVVLGASAGAMVLGGWTVLPDRGNEVVRGLAVVPNVVVLPHYTGGQHDWVAALTAVVRARTALLGLPEESGVVLADGCLTAVGRHASTLVGDRVLDVGSSRPW